MIENCSSLDTPELAADVKQFFDKTTVPQGDMAVSQMVERMNVNVRMRKEESSRMMTYLGKK
jgi:hypothetical protein